MKSNPSSQRLYAELYSAFCFLVPPQDSNPEPTDYETC